MIRILLVLIALLGCCFKPCRAGVDEKTILFSGESPYSSVRVFETEHGYRAIALGSLWQTVIDPRDPEVVFFAYARTMLAGLAYWPTPSRDILFIGLGGGSTATYIQRKLPNGRYAVAEIDPLVVELAGKYFDFDKEKFSVHVQDGRQYLRKTTKTYDFIALDAFRGEEIPFHLTTVEFMTLLKSRLNADGVAAFHLWEAKRNKYFDSQLATIAAVFPISYLFYAGDGSYVVFATNSEKYVDKESWANRGKDLAEKAGIRYDLYSIINKQYSVLSAQGKNKVILTDDFAPVNLMREQPVK